MGKFYTLVIRIINYLVKIANMIKIHKCSQDGRCMCEFCTKEGCVVKHNQPDKLV